MFPQEGSLPQALFQQFWKNFAVLLREGRGKDSRIPNSLNKPPRTVWEMENFVRTLIYRGIGSCGPAGHNAFCFLHPQCRRKLQTLRPM